MGVIKFSTSLSFYIYCRIDRLFQDLQNLSYSDGGVANSTEQQLLWYYAIVMLISCNFIRIYRKGLNMDLLSEVRFAV